MSQFCDGFAVVEHMKQLVCMFSELSNGPDKIFKL